MGISPDIPSGFEQKEPKKSKTLDFEQGEDKVWRDVGKDLIEKTKGKIDFYFGDPRDFMFGNDDYDR